MNILFLSNLWQGDLRLSSRNDVPTHIGLFVCFVTKTFLPYSFSSPTPDLSTICKLLSSCTSSITSETANFGGSYSHMRGPDMGCWFSDRSNCSQWSFEAAVLPINPNIYSDKWETIGTYHSIKLLVVIHQSSPRCWHLDSNYCRTRCWQSQPRFVGNLLYALAKTC